MIFTNLKLALHKLGIGGTIRLLTEKQSKQRRLSKLLRSNSGSVVLLTHGNDDSTVPNALSTISDEEIVTITERADEMLRDENYFFTFTHHLKNIPDPWNYDPIENMYWQKKRYEETRVHSSGTPKDVKIVWEINRFKYLPLLAQAAYITKEKKYIDEIEARILSWIDDNPFAGSINWSSPLEIAIRAISWTASLRILNTLGYDLSKNDKISRSLWQHAAYLNAELSTDKIVRSNHLIGETAGLYILSSFFDFPEAVFYRLRAKKILADSIIKQTYPDGASRESSGWYHTFITDFADLALRTANTTGDTFDTVFLARFKLMTIYRNSIMLPDGDAVKFGDIDFGKAINLPLKWKDQFFGINTIASRENSNYFDKAQHLTARLDKNYVCTRAGEFGWGGNGFSSHAHDDFLSPIVALDGINILVDPGTFAYNGAPEEREAERSANYHNGLIIGENTGAIMKTSFGWLKTRPDARIEYFSSKNDEIVATGSYGEWHGQHTRSFTLTNDQFILEDHLLLQNDHLLEWNFHLHPRWRLEKITDQHYALLDFRDNHYEFELSGIDEELEVLRYDFFPAYRQKSKAWKIRIKSQVRANEERNVKISLRKK